MSSQNQKTENVYLKYSWIIFVAIGIFGFAFALFSIISPFLGIFTNIESETGVNWDQFATANPEMATLILESNYWLMAVMASIALFSIIIAWKGFRHGEKWAWYTMWLLPITNGLISIETLFSINDYLSTTLLGIVIVIIYVRCILLPYKAFFPPTAATSKA